MNVFQYVFTSLQGAPMRLGNWQGQPILVVNTASNCIYTPQYFKLQRLYAEYSHSGLVIIGMPCNDFGAEEPDDEETIAQFCSAQFRVTFPMTSKISIMGYSAHPMFQAVRDFYGSEVMPRWNFHKILFGREGSLLNYWPSKTEPDDPAMTHQIERNLNSWVY